MKQKIYILGVITAMVILLGTIFKINHWPAAGIMLTAGLVTLVLVFLPLALIDSYRGDENKLNKPLYIATGVTGFVIFTGMLFKIMHWPYAGPLLAVALIFPYIVFLPVFIIVTSRNKNFNIYNMVFVFLLLALNSVFSGLLALNVSRERIHDSYNLSRTFNKAEMFLNQLPAGDSKSQVSLQIDKVLKIVDEYQNLILKEDGSSKQLWEAEPDNLFNPDNPNIPMAALWKSGESNPGDRLQNAFKELLAFMEQDKRYEAAAKVLPAIIGQTEEIGMEPDWTIRRVSGTHLTWVLIYLDGLETNLKMLKVTLPSTVN
jgi:hypothetical protein